MQWATRHWLGPVDWKSLGSSFRSSPVAKAVTMMCGGAAIIVVALCRTTANVSNGAVSQINRPLFMHQYCFLKTHKRDYAEWLYGADVFAGDGWLSRKT